MSPETMREALSAFDLGSPALSALPHGQGHINDTFRVTTQSGKEFILQRISAAAFHRPDRVMENMLRVTEHLRQKIAARGGDPDRETLTVVPTRDGGSFYTDSRGGAWRATLFIRDSRCYLSPQNPRQLFAAGEAFGRFQGLLADYPAHTLHETIPRFHDTVDRLEKLKAAAQADPLGRRESCLEELSFALSRESDCSVALGAQRGGLLPLHVTHNDAKLSNILFDARSHQPLCVVDLDTVMPGLAIYDFGDLVRSGAHRGREDDRDPSRVQLDRELFRALAAGFIRGADGALSREELAFLPWGGRLMTLECGIRFLTDYLEGDVYFHTSRDRHNLDRCRTQFKLVGEMESSWAELNAIIAEYA